MRRVALKGLWWRRGRAVLTALAVVLGVAMVSGTFILTDTINKAFDSIFQDSYAKTGAVISGREVVKDAASGNATVPASVLARVRANDNVAQASGAIFNLSGISDQTKLIGWSTCSQRLTSRRSFPMREPRRTFIFNVDSAEPFRLAGQQAVRPGDV